MPKENTELPEEMQEAATGPQTYEDVVSVINIQRDRLDWLLAWVDRNRDLVDLVSKCCRSYWSPFGLVAYPLGDVSELITALKLERSGITTKVDGLEITLHHL